MVGGLASEQAVELGVGELVGELVANIRMS